MARYPDVEGFLEVACPVLTEYFGDSVEIVLEVLAYSTGETTHEELVGWIQSTDDINEGLARLSRFEDEWFLNHMDEVDHKFNFNIETR